MSIPEPRPSQGYASIGQRIGASFIDALAYAMLYVVVIVVVIGAFRNSGLLVVFVFYGLVLVYSIFVLFLVATKGYSPGKKLLGLRVIDENTDQPIGWGRAFLRALVLGAIGGLTCGIGNIVNAAVANGHPRRQGWHDLAVHSVVTTSDSSRV